jgi:hypothetical protein
MRQNPTARSHLPAPPRVAAKSPHNPASGLEPCSALPSGCTRRNIPWPNRTILPIAEADPQIAMLS